MHYQELENIINYINTKKRPKNKQEALNFYMQKYIELQDAPMVADLALYFMDIADLDFVDNFLLQLKNPYACWRFAMYAPTRHFAQHEEVVLQANNPSYSISLAKIKGADVARHSKVVLASNSALNSYEFLAVNSKTDKKEHLSVILQDNNPYHLLKTAIKLRGVGCKKIENAILKFNNPEYSYIYATNVPGADIESHQSMVLYTGTLADVLKFAQDVEKTNIRFYINRLWEQFEKKPSVELKETLLKLLDLYDERNKPEQQSEKQ